MYKYRISWNASATEVNAADVAQKMSRQATYVEPCEGGFLVTVEYVSHLVNVLQEVWMFIGYTIAVTVEQIEGDPYTIFAINQLNGEPIRVVAYIKNATQSAIFDVLDNAGYLAGHTVITGVVAGEHANLFDAMKVD